MLETGAIRCGESYDLAVPAHLQRALSDEGGLNRYGEPIYRLVWGWSRLELRVGEFHEFDDHGNWIGARLDTRHEPKYGDKPDRYHLELWVPPEKYGSPADWYAVTRKVVAGRFVEHLGEYPSRGDYERICTCQTPTGGYVLPTEQAVRDLVRWHKTAKTRTPVEIRAQLEEADRKRAAARKNRMIDAIDGNARAFPWRVWMPTSGPLPKPLVA